MKLQMKEKERVIDMNQIWKRAVCLVTPLSLILSGCGAGGNVSGPSVPPQIEETEEESAVISQVTGIPFGFQAVPEDFSLVFKVKDQTLPVSGSGEQRVVSDYEESGDGVSWRYPEEDVAVSVMPVEDYLQVEITSEKAVDHSFTWPNISSETYYFPFGEGKRVPADDLVWQNYLDQQEFSVIEQLSMPFWVSVSGDYTVLFIMEDPYRTRMQFAADPEITFSVTHEYPEIDENRTNRFRIYLTENDPVMAAKLYKNYVIENGEFVTLEQKAAENENIRKLYGAPFIYLWGDFVISAEDINWKAFRQSLSSPIMTYLRSFADDVENGQEFLASMKEMASQDYVAEYQKQIVCSYISQLLKRDNFLDISIFVKSNSGLDSLLEAGYENLTESQKIQANKYALAANLPEVFSDAGTWMDASTITLLDEMKASGIDQAWIGLNSWEQAYAKPELVEQAAELGYLIASYDSYHSIHEPGSERWITAKFDDTSLYENASVINRNGEKEKGFQGVGRKLNPALSLPSVKNRMEDIMSNQLSFNSWFIDCDATGEIYDDYTPSHITPQEKDLAARMERMSYIRDQYHQVIGSEGGNDFAASTIAYAHGIELKTFSWMDEDMKENKDSKYYIGKYYNPNGGVAEHFSKRIPIKEEYYTIFADPQYDIPLFKLVYNDSVITSYHWDWSTFKIKDIVPNRMIREVLYNVPPLYHLDAAEWETYGEEIASHNSVWSEFSKQAVIREMTGFQYLEEDGSVQKTFYGDYLTATANFSDTAYQSGNTEIPAHSVLIQMDGRSEIYTPSFREDGV